MKQYLIDQIQHLDEKKKELQNDLETYVQDKSLPLSDRWEVFCLAGDIVPKQGHIVRFETLEVNNIVDGYSRREEVDLIVMIEFIEETTWNINVQDFKEEILIKFIRGFNYDW